MHKLFNISRSKTNQTFNQLKLFSQLTEYNMEIHFLKNHTLNVVEKLFSDPLLKNQNGAYL